MMDLRDRVDYVGFVEHKADKAALLKTSDAFVAPFIKSEPFGLVYCEAMAAGLPVVAPHMGAGPEIISWDGRKAGLVYRSQDTGQMADAMKYLVEHREEARAMGEEGRHGYRALQRTRMASDIKDLFADAIERKRLRTHGYHPVTV